MNKTLESIVKYPQRKLDDALMTHFIRETLSDTIAKEYTLDEINKKVQELILDTNSERKAETRMERFAEDILEATRYYVRPDVKTLKRAHTKKLFEPYENEKWIYRIVHKGIAKGTPVKVNNKTLHGVLSVAAGITIGRIHHTPIRSIAQRSGISEKFMTNGMIAGETLINYFSTIQNVIAFNTIYYLYNVITGDNLSEEFRDAAISALGIGRYMWSAIGIVANTLFDKYLTNPFMYLTPTSAPVMIGSKILDIKEKYEKIIQKETGILKNKINTISSVQEIKKDVKSLNNYFKQNYLSKDNS